MRLLDHPLSLSLFRKWEKTPLRPTVHHQQRVECNINAMNEDKLVEPLFTNDRQGGDKDDEKHDPQQLSCHTRECGEEPTLHATGKGGRGIRRKRKGVEEAIAMREEGLRGDSY